jgi:hypothetical protein
MECLIIPEANNGKPSILFKSLLESGLSREEAKKLYKKSYSKGLLKKLTPEQLDANGEPFMSVLIGKTKLASDLQKEGVLKDESYTDQAGREVFTVVGEDTKSKVQNRIKMNDLVDQGKAEKYLGSPGKYVLLQQASKDKRTVNEEINTKLLSFLAAYGIRVEHVDNMKERLGVDANGAALIFDRLILIAKGKEKIDTLPEEVAHFVVELLGEDNPLIARLLDIIEDSAIYTETFEEYSGVYLDNKGNPDIHKIKKEAVGKAISKGIINNAKFEAPKGFFKTLKMAWNRFMSIFKKMDHGRYLDEVSVISDWIAEDILKGKLEGKEENLMTPEVFYQVEEEVEEDTRSKQEIFLSKAIANLRNRVEELRKKPKFKEESDSLRLEVDKLEALLDMKKIKAGLISFTAKAKDEIAVLTKFKDDYNEANLDNGLSADKIHRMAKTIDMYEVLLSEVESAIKDDPELKASLKDTLQDIRGVRLDLNDLTAFREEQIEKGAWESITKMNGGRIDIDRSILKEVSKDTNILRRFVGNLQNASDPVLKLVYDALKRIKNNINDHTYERGREMVRLQQELDSKGIDMSIFFEKDSKGNKTGYLISETMHGKKFDDIDNTLQEIADKLGYESFYEINHENLSPKQDRIQREIWNKYFEKTKDNSYYNPAFEKVKNNPTALKYYNRLLEIKEEEDAKLPIGQNERQKYLMPQIRKDLLERFRNRDGGIVKNAREMLKGGVTLTADDIEYNERDAITDIKNKEIKFVPIHYTRKLKNVNELSEDLSSMMIAYSTMAENFKQKHDIVPDMELIQRQLGERPLKGKYAKQGTATETYALLDSFLDMNLYGNTKRRDQTLVVGGKEYNYGKALDKFNEYVRRNNLSFNAFASIASYTTGSINSKVEDAAGVYTTQESKNFAELEFDKNIFNVVSQIGKKRPTNKMHLMFMKNGFVSPDFKDLNMKTQAGRSIKDIFYSSYQLADYRIKGKTTLAVMDNMRLVGEEWKTKAQFKRDNIDLDKKEVNERWSKLRDKSFYNAHEVVDGEIVVKDKFKKYVTKDISHNIRNRATTVGNRVDGMISQEDRGAISRSIWGRLILTHRNWLIEGVEKRFKPDGVNLTTGEKEEGSFVSAWNAAAPIYPIIKTMIKEKTLSMKPLIDNWDKTEEHQKKNVKRVAIEMVSIAMLVILAKVFEGALGDDDDDVLSQYALYSIYRTKLEMGAFYSPTEIPKLIKSPAAGINQMESVLESFGTLIDWSEIERGRFKGYTKAEKMMIQRSFIRNFYDAAYPEDKLRYMKQFM